MGNLETVNDGTATIYCNYDGRGRKMTEIGGNTAKNFEYNTAGLLTESTIIMGGFVRQQVYYEYNESGQVCEVKENNATVSTYEYDAMGRQIKAIKANGVTEKTTYNAAGLVTSVVNSAGRDVISEYPYTYYYDGNQRTKTESKGTSSYAYDGLGRLKTAVLADGTVQGYTFDGNGNRKTMTVTKGGISSLTEYEYDLNDRLLEESSGSNVTTYTYDANGNMLTKGDTVQELDVLNRMTSYDDGEVYAEYTYNADNMRQSKTVDSVTTEHVWIGSNIALDIVGSDVISYISSIKSDYGWYVFNAHGDVVQLCDGFGEIIRDYDYDPFGNALHDEDSADENPYRFCGEYYDAESGYVYLRARYYDSSVGRFISEDPALDGYNWYVYCGGNPIGRWDPSGKSWKSMAKSFGAGFRDHFAGRWNSAKSATLKSLQPADNVGDALINGLPLPFAIGVHGTIDYIKVSYADWKTKTPLEQSLSSMGPFGESISMYISDAKDLYYADYDHLAYSCGGRAGQATEALATAAVVGGVEKLSTRYSVPGQEDMMYVTRYGRPGLEPGDWVVPGQNTKWTYFKSFKWDFISPTNEVAPQSSGETYIVPKDTVQWPTGKGMDGSWKGFFGQRNYIPPNS